MESRDKTADAHPAQELPTASCVPGRKNRSRGESRIMISGGPFGPQMIVFHSPDGDARADDPNPSDRPRPPGLPGGLGIATGVVA